MLKSETLKVWNPRAEVLNADVRFSAFLFAGREETPEQRVAARNNYLVEQLGNDYCRREDDLN
jgi:hypothetical protein